MKKRIPGFWIIFLLIVGAMFAGQAAAEDIYVTGVTNITMRTGPGVEHKILAMLKSGTKLEIVEQRSDWSQVKTDSQKIGWVLSRFLTQKVPDALVVEGLRKENQELVSRLEALEDENRTLSVKNAALVEVEEKYNKLKQESSDFLKLDAKYKATMKEYEAQKIAMEKLTDNLNNDEKLWFLSGAGVFIVGLFLGLSMRKKKKSSLL